MTPNFALSLSFDGIRLLHRVDGGWSLAGEVSLDAPDLAVAMKALRATAIGLEPDGLRTKLLLPNDQIKYLALDSTRTSLADIQQAMDAATVIPLDELVIDFERTGGRTQIAAVARQTLEEAESFAKEHGFAPITFVAVGEPFTFSTEVFFGATAYAHEVFGKKAGITRDTSPAIVTHEPAVVSAPVVATPVPAIDADPAPEPIPEVVFRREPSTAPADTQTPDVASKTTAAVEITHARRVADDKVAGDQVVGDHKTPDVGDQVTGNAPVLDAPSRTTDDTDPIAFFSRNPPTPTPADETAKPHSAAPIIATRTSPEEPVKDSNAALAGITHALARLKRATASKTPKDKTDVAQDTISKPLKPKKAPYVVGGKPKYLALILTAVLLVVMVIIAIVANNRLENGLAGLFVPPQAPSQAPSQVSEIAALPATATTEDTPEVVAAPVSAGQTTQPPGMVLSPAEAARIYAATGVWQRAPRLPDGGRIDTLDGLAVMTPVTLVQPLAPLGRPEVSRAAPDRNILAPPNPNAPDLPVQRDARGFILADPNGTLLPTGVMIYGRAPDVTPQSRPTTGQTPAVAAVAETPELPAADAVDDSAALAASLTPLARPSDVEDTADLLPADPALAGLRPTIRPDSLAPAPEAAPFADPALAGLRPSLRPADFAPPAEETIAEQEDAPEIPLGGTDISAMVASIAAAAPPSQIVNPTRLAIAASPRPDPRPNNFGRVVAAAQTRAAPPQAAPAAAAPVATAPARSSGPAPTTVARAATMTNAIRMRDMNLIGVYGRPGNRRALIRLSNGRFVKVEVGSNLDGGRVTAIGDSALNFVRRGQTFALKLPTG